MFGLTSFLLLALAGVAQTQYGYPRLFYPPPPPYGYFGFGGINNFYDAIYGRDDGYQPQENSPYEINEFSNPTSDNCRRINTTKIEKALDTKITYFTYKEVEYALLKCPNASAAGIAVTSVKKNANANDFSSLVTGTNFQYLLKCGKHGKFIGKFSNGTSVNVAGALCYE